MLYGMRMRPLFTTRVRVTLKNFNKRKDIIPLKNFEIFTFRSNNHRLQHVHQLLEQVSQGFFPNYTISLFPHNVVVAFLCEGNIRPATVFCEQCDIFYCQSCQTALHPSRGPLAKHTLISAGQRRIASTRVSRDVKCAVHRQETLSMYCVPCRCPVCCLCLQDARHSSHDVQALAATCKAQKVMDTLYWTCLLSVYMIVSHCLPPHKTSSRMGLVIASYLLTYCLTNRMRETYMRMMSDKQFEYPNYASRLMVANGSGVEEWESLYSQHLRLKMASVLVQV
uniref:B box-type domain-containing protein n=1 Tax=Heterorhabditis bacteriophora TaxID=37862 RepID=A0A1I7WCS6_HETBA